MTGAQIKEWLEMSAGQFNQIDPNSKEPQQLINSSYRSYNYDVIDGLTYKFDLTQPNKYDREGKLVNPDASRVRDLAYQGQPIDLNQTFLVVTNNYRATGNFPVLRMLQKNASSILKIVRPSLTILSVRKRLIRVPMGIEFPSKHCKCGYPFCLIGQCTCPPC